MKKVAIWVLFFLMLPFIIFAQYGRGGGDRGGRQPDGRSGVTSRVTTTTVSLSDWLPEMDFPQSDALQWEYDVWSFNDDGTTNFYYLMSDNEFIYQIKYLYDEDGNLIETQSLGDDRMNGYIMYYYDQATLQTLSYWDLDIVSYREADANSGPTYDSEGRLIKYVDPNFDVFSGDGYNTFEYFYNNDDQMVTQKSYISPIGSGYVANEAFVWEYNDDGTTNLKYEYELRDNLTLGELWMTTEYEYNSSGQLIKESEWYEGWEDDVAYFDYTYDSEGNLEKRAGNLWGYWSTTFYEYDDEGREIGYEETTPWEVFEWTYEYDDDGNLIFESYSETEDGEIISLHHYTFTYDDEGRMLTQLWEVVESFYLTWEGDWY